MRARVCTPDPQGCGSVQPGTVSQCQPQSGTDQIHSCRLCLQYLSQIPLTVSNRNLLELV